MIDRNHQITSTSGCRALYRVGAAAAWAVVLLTMGVVTWLTIFPQPATVEGWFELFQRTPLIGVLDFWGLEVLMYPMFVLVFLSLDNVLRESAPVRMTVALVFGLLGVGIFLANNNPFTMLSLSREHAAAVTASERAMLLAAGKAVLVGTGQRVVGGFNVGLFLVSLAGLITSTAFFKGGVFRRQAGYLGLAAFGLSLLDYFRQMITSSTLIALLVILPNAILLVIWFGRIGSRLYQLGREVEPGQENPGLRTKV